MPVYDAFISYSHAKDKPIAAALQSVIQKLGKPWYRRRGLRVFRDDTSLSATPQLWPSIERALAQSRYLLLLSSPESAASPWVGKEVEYWLTYKSTDTLLIGVTDGTLHWDGKTGDFRWEPTPPLPAALKRRFPAEPKWVDLTAYLEGADPRDARFLDLGADFAAAIHGMPKEDLLSQEVRQQKRALTLATTTAALLLVLFGLATWQWQRAGWALAAATKGTNTLVSEVAIKFRDIAGVPIDRVRDILDRTLELQSELARIGGDRPDVKRSEAMARRELSTTVRMQGNVEDALGYASTSKAIIERLLVPDPQDPELRRELSLSLNRVGEALGASGRQKEALQAFRRSLDIRHALASGGQPAAQRDLALSQERVADALLGLDRTVEAATAYAAALKIREGLLAAEPNSVEWALDLAVSHDKNGNLLLADGKIDEALGAYEAALKIREEVLAEDPDSVRCQRDLSSSYIRLGEVLLVSGRPEEAIAEFRQALPLREALAKDRDNVGAQLDLVLALVKAAEAGDEPQARLAQASAIVHALESEGKLPPDRKAWAAEIRDRLAEQLLQTEETSSAQTAPAQEGESP